MGTVRYPRLVPKDADSATKLKKRTLTNLDNKRPAWLANVHQRLDEAPARREPICRTTSCWRSS